METINATAIISRDLLKVGFKVALNKANTLNLPQFHSRGCGNAVPDLFFWNPKYKHEIFNSEFIPRDLGKIRAGFIEIKTGEHKKDLYDGVFQNTEYYSYFISNKSVISIEDSRIHNIDVFLLGTIWSRTGMLYRGDEDYIPKPIPYVSEKYNFIVPPYTNMFHGLQRKLQQLKRQEIRNNKVVLPKNKMKVQTGIMISKIPLNENETVSYEYYAWLGNQLFPIRTSPVSDCELVKTRVKILKKTEKAILVLTKLNRQLWLPKSQVEIKAEFEPSTPKYWIDVEIARWFYAKKTSFFGFN